MQNEGGDVELLEVFVLVGFGESLNAVVDGFVFRHHSLQPEEIAQTLRDFRIRTVGAIERGAQIPAELGAVGLDADAKRVEGLDGKFVSVVRTKIGISKGWPVATLYLAKACADKNRAEIAALSYNVDNLHRQRDLDGFSACVAPSALEKGKL